MLNSFTFVGCQDDFPALDQERKTLQGRILCLEFLLLGNVHRYMGIDFEAESLGKYHEHFLRLLSSRFPKRDHTG